MRTWWNKWGGLVLYTVSSLLIMGLIMGLALLVTNTIIPAR